MTRGRAAGSLQAETPIRWARAAGMLGAIFLLLYLVYQPAVDVLHSVGDVEIYRDYARGLLAQPRQWPREYPALSAAIFVTPQLVSPDHYIWAFACMAGLAAWLMFLVVDRLSGRGWQLILLFLLGAGGTMFFRYDVFVALTTVLAFAAASRRRWLLAQALLALGVALKIYPAILMPLVVVSEWREMRRLPWRSAIGGGALVLAVLGAMGLLGPEQVMAMVRYQTERPLEFGSIGASLAWVGGPVEPVFSFGSWNFVSPLSWLLVPLLSGLGLALLLALYALSGLGLYSPAASWALALLAALCTSKVLSPQYLMWVLPFIAMARPSNGRDPGYLDERWSWGTICLLTSIIYPLTFEPFVSPVLRTEMVPTWWIAMVGVRNALLVGATGMAVMRWRERPEMADT